MRLVGKEKKSFVFIAILNCITKTISYILFSYAIKILIDYFVEDTVTEIYLVVIYASLLLVVNVFIKPYSNYLFKKRVESIISNVRIRLFAKLNRMTILDLKNTHSADIGIRFNKDIDVLREALSIIRKLFGIIISLLLLIPYFAVLDIRFGLISIGTSFIFALACIKFVLPMRNHSRKIHNSLSNMSEIIVENVIGFNVIKQFDLSEYFFDKYKKSSSILVDKEVKLGNLDGKLAGLNFFLNRMNKCILAVIGCVFVFNNTLMVGSLVAIITTCRGITRSLTSIVETPTKLQKSLSGVDRLNEIFNTLEEKKSFQIEGTSNNNFAYENITFGYDSDVKIIKNVSIEFNKGDVIAFVGESGSGKSTFARLMLCFHEIWEGRVTLNNKPLKAYKIFDIRKMFSYVSQEAYIFSGTILENIMFGKPNATIYDAIDAAKKANAHDFIIKKKEQYNTFVGERGVNLSGGERQRIALARAILKDAPIFILDEATSSLDSKSEKFIENTISDLVNKKTIIIIAHRLSTIKDADMIYVFDNGEIVEKGNHSQLLNEKGKYNELYYVSK